MICKFCWEALLERHGARLVAAGEIPRNVKQVGRTRYDGRKFWRRYRCRDCGALRYVSGEVGAGFAIERWERPHTLH